MFHSTNPLPPSDKMIVTGVRQSSNRMEFEQARGGEDGSHFALSPVSGADRRVEAFKRALHNAAEECDCGMVIVALPPDDEEAQDWKPGDPPPHGIGENR